MFQSQQQLQQSSFTYFPQPSNSIPNSLLSFPQPPTLPSQPLLFPPGTDPYAHTGQFTLTHVEFEAQAQFYEDPNVGSGSWITRQADPIRYDATSSVVALNSSSNNDWMNQSLVNKVLGSTPNESKLIQPVRCEVCNILCNTKDVYEKHLMGKKHQKNLQVKINPTTAIFPEASNTINNVSIVGQTGNAGGQMIFGASGVANGQELERKKQKLLSAGAAVDSVRMCTICNVACNSHDAFTKHLSGRRHAAQAGLIAVDGIGPYLAALRANDHFWKKGKKTTKIYQSTWCEVCKINCTSNDVYAKHLSGKKHLKNLENLEKSKNGICDPSIDTPAARNLIIGSVENPSANGSNGVNVQQSEKRAAKPEASKEDLEMKKRKVMQGGAAAAAVRVCTICNVVCNSQKVFSYHLTGQKHGAMVKKQADAR
ncbi:zinc finger protein 346-like [Durio zibethinus]|uniref:Zinc finger protein 346-like n=1 Tax=Durio zibethinus TaxID=66656 RepID=A0A6P5Y8P1_DURZI|nr:zinc finger protein 346-like [Durio zibethinus]